MPRDWNPAGWELAARGWKGGRKQAWTGRWAEGLWC